MNALVQEISNDYKIFVGKDFNGQMGNSNYGFEWVHEGSDMEVAMRKERP